MPYILDSALAVPRVWLSRRFRFGIWLLSFCCCATVGCAPPTTAYRPNTLHAASLLHESGDEDPVTVAEQAAACVEEWFGTAEEPKWPETIVPLRSESLWLDMVQVKRCAGAIGRGPDKIERGLFRKHCTVCHGITGDGLGAAASLLAPYPRDFRRGTFKFKSTPAGFKPTREDLGRTLRAGIPGTAMPSFATLDQSEEFANDIEALVEYVRYLSIRGEVERRLITKNIREGIPIDSDAREAQQIVRDVVQKWTISDEQVVTVPPNPDLRGDELQASIERGQEWFRSELTACVKCHGAEGRGDGASQDFDEWTKDWTLFAGIDPKDRSAWKVMKVFGALKPVIDPPRNFVWRAYRGGARPEDLFRRLVLGIEGSPMPPIARADGSNPGLSDDQIWDLVHYVRSLGEAP